MIYSRLTLTFKTNVAYLFTSLLFIIVAPFSKHLTCKIKKKGSSKRDFSTNNLTLFTRKFTHFVAGGWLASRFV